MRLKIQLIGKPIVVVSAISAWNQSDNVWRDKRENVLLLFCDSQRTKIFKKDFFWRWIIVFRCVKKHSFLSWKCFSIFKNSRLSTAEFELDSRICRLCLWQFKFSFVESFAKIATIFQNSKIEFQMLRLKVSVPQRYPNSH